MAKPMEWWSRSAAAKYGEGEEEGKGEERDTSEDLRYPPLRSSMADRKKLGKNNPRMILSTPRSSTATFLLHSL